MTASYCPFRLFLKCFRTLVLSGLLVGSVVPASANLNIPKLINELVIVDGVIYVKNEVNGFFLIGGQWVAPTGNRAFYAANRLPMTDLEWDQLLNDINIGGTAVIDFLRDNLESLMVSNRLPDVVSEVNTGLLSGTGLSAPSATQWLDDIFTSVVANPFESRPAGLSFSALNLADRDFEGMDLRGTGVTGYQLSTTGSLSGSDLGFLDLTGFLAGNRTFDGTNFEGTDLAGSIWTNVPSFAGIDFATANLTGSDFSGANLTGVNFGRANMAGTNFTGATSATDTNGNFADSYTSGSGIFGVVAGSGRSGNFTPSIPDGTVKVYGPWVYVSFIEDNVLGVRTCYELWARTVFLRWVGGVFPDVFFEEETERRLIPCPQNCSSTTGGG